jgi:hypothetical protein
MSRRDRLIGLVLIGGALLLCGLVLEQDIEWEGSAAGYVIALVIPVLAGFAWGRWKAVWWIGAAPWLAIGITYDVLWAAGVIDPGGGEPVPATIGVLLVLPFLLTAVSIGVVTRKGIRALRQRPAKGAVTNGGAPADRSV